MFGKKHDRIETLIGVSTQIKGTIELKGTLRLDGGFEGNVKADWVVVGEKGHLKGDIYANGVVVGGLVEGNINARQYIEIMTKGKVFGDVYTSKFAILEGGLFEGHSKMQNNEIEGEISVSFKKEIE
ncbi:MAG: polymer-forming cytoskeletal protein [Nitrospirae bacterium]|uniref:bactofilin family protein n=1 Tax=Candidatus Magnetobacterium casense TaxID=1455061 RepID=UPI00058D455E|nr:polymer-forming cytoskeletal protein [Candidatus Magnetobacterium casensis]MBF0338737.1 polymer-forming cytoskeletal protein [Nitrospirota bacterium]